MYDRGTTSSVNQMCIFQLARTWDHREPDMKNTYNSAFLRNPTSRQQPHFVTSFSESWVLCDGKSVSNPLCPLAGLGTVGPGIIAIWVGSERTKAVTAYLVMANHNADQRMWIANKTDKYLAPLVEPRLGRHLETVDKLWPEAGHLLVGARFWLNTVRVIAMQAEAYVLASTWRPVSIEVPMLERSLTVWLNSSFDFLTLLAVRKTTQVLWTQLKKADLHDMPVLDMGRLPSLQIQELADSFDQLVGVEFERTPGMAVRQTRRVLDNGLSKVLALPDLSTLRALPASDPVVANRRL